MGFESLQMQDTDLRYDDTWTKLTQQQVCVAVVVLRVGTSECVSGALVGAAGRQVFFVG